MCGPPHPPSSAMYEIWAVTDRRSLPASFLETWASDHREQHGQVRQHGLDALQSCIAAAAQSIYCGLKRCVARVSLKKTWFSIKEGVEAFKN